MNHGVFFEVDGIRKHSADDFGLEFISYDLNFPEVKESYTEIVGGHGSIDHTEAFGKIFYKDRKITLNFESKAGFNYIIREISTFLHGKIAKITIYDDEEYYYLGRVHFNKYMSDRKNGKVILDVIAEPFKYKQEKTIVISDIKTKKVVNYKCGRLEVVPVFKASAPLTFEYNGNSYALDTNTVMYEDIIFSNGDNFITYHGNGTVTVEYTEGDF